MFTQLPLDQKQLCLPNIDLIKSSEQAFANAFLKSAQILHGYLEEIETAIDVTKEFTRKPLNLAILGLFSKMRRNYYSYVLLETHRDRVGSQFLIEHLCETAITLTYLLEEVDEATVHEYISASIQQAWYLLLDVQEQLLNFPDHLDLLILKDNLKTFIAKHQDCAADSLLSTNTEANLWELQEPDTTVKRGALLGLNFLINPARQIALKVEPASWLDSQLNYLNFSLTNTQPITNFRYLRDASHLCLHATQAFLEKVNNYPDKHQQQFLNALYEWFHNAHNVYQQEIVRSGDSG